MVVCAAAGGCGVAEKGKPFFTLPDNVRQGFENWNFNVSHHGEFVAIASEPTLLVRRRGVMMVVMMLR